MRRAIKGRDVSLTALTGDILNQRNVTTQVNDLGHRTWTESYADNAARIEAGNSLSLGAGRDVNNLGSVLTSGGSLDIGAGRDVTLATAMDISGNTRGTNYSQQTIKQLGSELNAGRDLSITAERNLTSVASKINAGGDLSLSAGNVLTLASAADESHFHSKSKRVTRQDDVVSQQGTELSAGNSLSLTAGSDLTLIASSAKAGNEAYLVAGDGLNLLAANDEDYHLYQKKSKGSFGSKSFKRDETTEINAVGSTITAGSDISLISGGDQLYQGAKLDSGNDLTLASGGEITFEAVKDYEQESHEKSKSDLAWQSSKGKGNTDETLRQSQIIAQGQVAIHAAEGLNIDIKHIDQKTVSQTIDVMVEADPSLAWIKQAEARGDVDWTRVKEVHDSFKYSNSGLGAGSQIVIAIIIAYFTAGAASGLVASGASAAGASTAAGSAWASTAAVGGAGWANAAVSAGIVGAASNATISTINNRGNLGAIVDDVTSSDAVRGYAVAGVTAGLTTGIYDGWTGTETGASTALSNSGPVTVNGGLSSWSGVGSFTANQGLQNGTSLLVDRALGGDSKFSDALQSTLANSFTAAGFNLVGDVSGKNNLDLENGSLAKVGLHALMGGLAAEAAGGDFKTGAIAAGANEALVGSLADQYKNMDPDERKSLLVMNSQLIGVLAAATLSDADGESLQTGAWVAQNGTYYNRQLHEDDESLAQKLAKKSDGRFTKQEIEDALRISSRVGEDVYPGTDMVTTQDGIYDTGGRWVKYGDTYVQLLPVDVDPDVANFILDNSSKYSFDDSTLGITKESNAVGTQEPRDRLTGYSLDEGGGYRVPVSIDGAVYQPRFWPCGSAECIAAGANIDFGDVNTLRWLKAGDIKALDDFSKIMTAGAIVGSGGVAAGLANTATVASLFSGYLNDTVPVKFAESVLSSGFEKYATSRGLPVEAARKMTNALSVSGAWSKIVENSEIFRE